jgi:hypothetical protein
MTRRIAHLIEEQENRSKLFNTRDPDVEAARTLEDSKNTEVPISDKEEVLPLSPKRESPQYEVIMSKARQESEWKKDYRDEDHWKEG